MSIGKAWVPMLAFVLIAAPACSSGSGNGKAIKVELSDYSIKPASTSVAPGKVTFEAHNSGNFEHELVVMKAKTADIAVKPNGEADEEAVPEAEHMGEVEGIAPGKTAKLKLDLEAGTYVLLCNRTDGDIAHYQKGMHTEFVVK